MGGYLIRDGSGYGATTISLIHGLRSKDSGDFFIMVLYNN